MRRGTLVVLLLFSSILFVYGQKTVFAEGCATSSGWSSLKINEFSAFGSADWVELFNPLDMCVDLYGLSLHDSGQNAMRNYQKGAEIAPHGWYVTSTGSRLDNLGDALKLMYDDLIFDDIFYSTGTFCGTGENYVCARKIDGIDTDSGLDWALSLTSTQGAANQIQGPPISDPPPDEDGGDSEENTPTSTFDAYLWSQLQINEVMVDPNADENEWVELHNASTSTIDLSGGILCDAKESNCEIGSSSSTIVIGGYLVLTWDSSELNNSGDKVIWKNPEGIVVDEIQYGEGFLPVATDGKTLARTGDGSRVITTTPTPGEANQIVAPPVPVTNSGGGGGSSSNSGSAVNNIETKTKTTVKTTTTTVKIKEDPIKIVWKVNIQSQGAPGESLIFDASDSADPRGGLLNILWNFSDGIQTVGEKVRHVYTTSGTYAVLVSATSTVGTIGAKKLNVRVASGLATKNTGIKISEVLVNPIGADKKEYIKLYNSSSSTVDITGWKLIYNDKEYIMPDKTNILASSTLVFYQAVTHFMLNNSGGKVELLTPDDNLVDVVNYGKISDGQVVISTSTSQVLGVKIVDADNVSKSTKPTTAAKYFYGGLMSITDARAAVKNTSVKIKGMVTALPGAFGAQYFYIGDGPVGMQIYQNKKLFPDLQIGDVVEVSGITSASGAIKRVNVKNKADIRVVSHSASTSTTAIIEDLNEEMLGGLIKIAGEITEIKSNYMYVDDGTTELVVYFKQGAKIDKKKFKEGELVEIDGVLEKNKTDIQLWPRGQDDIKVVGQSEDLLDKEKNNSATGNNMLQTYLIVTAGGIAILVLGALFKKYWMSKS